MCIARKSASGSMISRLDRWLRDLKMNVKVLDRRRGRTEDRNVRGMTDAILRSMHMVMRRISVEVLDSHVALRVCRSSYPLTVHTHVESSRRIVRRVM